MSKIFNINNYRQRNNLFSKKMLFISTLVAVVIGLVLWKFLVENIANYDVKIPPSSNITFNDKEPVALTTEKIATDFESFDNKPILLYIYTTWCGICVKNLPIFNEIAREFQNTDLKIMAIAIDHDLEKQRLSAHLNNFGNIYFQPNYLLSKIGFKEFLLQKNIKYSGHIPFTVLIGVKGDIVAKYIGTKNKNYLRNRIIKELYPN